jgi:prephenate dehydratase
VKVGFLGPAGTFSEEALVAAGGMAALEPVALPTIPDAVLAVQTGAVARGFVPIENSIEGSVDVTLDTLAGEAPDVAIVGEVVHPVRICLVAREPVALADVRTVLSHPQPSGQCARFLRTELPGALVTPAPSTAEAVRLVTAGAHAALGVPEPAVALGPRLAAERYGATVLREGVEDLAGNETRFVWLAPAGTPTGDAAGRRWKTASVFWGPGDEGPGWLVRCLSEFAFRGVNLTRIESRPRREALGHYMFFADLDGRDSDAPVAGAIAGLRGQAEIVRVLGSFPAAA